MYTIYYIDIRSWTKAAAQAEAEAEEKLVAVAEAVAEAVAVAEAEAVGLSLVSLANGKTFRNLSRRRCWRVYIKFKKKIKSLL